MENLIGKWQITCLEVIQKSGRLVAKDYRKKNFIWEFFPNNELIESIAGQIFVCFEYEYYADFGILVIESEGVSTHYCM